MPDICGTRLDKHFFFEWFAIVSRVLGGWYFGRWIDLLFHVRNCLASLGNKHSLWIDQQNSLGISIIDLVVKAPGAF